MKKIAQYSSHARSYLWARSPDAGAKNGIQNTTTAQQERDKKTTKLNTSKLHIGAQRDRFKQEMDNFLAKREENEISTPDEELATL